MTVPRLLLAALAIVALLLAIALHQGPNVAPEAGWEAALHASDDTVKIPALDFFRTVKDEQVIDRAKRIDHMFAELFESTSRSEAVIWRALEVYDRLGFANKQRLGDAYRLFSTSGACQVHAAALRALGRHDQSGEVNGLIIEIIRNPSHLPCLDAPLEPGERPFGKSGQLAAALAAARDLDLPWTAGVTRRGENLQTLVFHFANHDSRVRDEAIETYLATGNQAVAYLTRLNERLHKPETTHPERAAIFDVFARLSENAAPFIASIDFRALDDDYALTAAALRARAVLDPLSDSEFAGLLAPGQSAHPWAVLEAVAQRGLSNPGAEPGRTLAAALELALRVPDPAADPEGILRSSILAALAASAETHGMQTAELNAIVLSLVDDQEMGLPVVRRAMVEAYWRVEKPPKALVQPLIDRLSPDHDPLTRAKAFELLEGVPEAFLDTVFEDDAIVDFIDRELEGQDVQADVVRAAILRILEKHGLHRPYRKTILALASDAQNDPAGEVRMVAIPMAAAGATTAELLVLYGLLAHDDDETFRIALRSLWHLPLADAPTFARLIDTIHRKRERRRDVLALAHVLGRGTRENQLLIKVLDIRALPVASVVSSEADRRLVFKQLRDMMLSSLFERGVTGSEAPALSATLRASILEQLTDLTQAVPWSCSDKRMLSAFLEEAKAKTGVSLFDGLEGETLHDSLASVVRGLNDRARCGALESIDGKAILDWIQDWIFWILGGGLALVLGYLKRKR